MNEQWTVVTRVNKIKKTFDYFNREGGGKLYIILLVIRVKVTLATSDCSWDHDGVGGRRETILLN